MFTPEKLAYLRMVCEAATPGPWEWWTSCSWRRLKNYAGKAVAIPYIAQADGHPDLLVKEHDMDFIKEARENMPLLIEEVERLREEINAERARKS